MSYIGLDLDGTILNYGAHHSEIRTNAALLNLLPKHADIVIISNQGGLPTNHILAAQVARRVFQAIQFLEDAGHEILWCYFSTYHPKATERQCANASKRLDVALRREFDDVPFERFWSIYKTEQSRKPSPYMLKLTEIEAYYGDSPEDAAAAKAAGIPFVSVPRFE